MTVESIFSKYDGQTERQTDWPTDRPTDIADSRVAFRKPFCHLFFSRCTYHSFGNGKGTLCRDSCASTSVRNGSILFCIHSVLNYASFGELGSAKHACSIWVCQYAKHYSMEISYSENMGLLIEGPSLFVFFIFRWSSVFFQNPCFAPNLHFVVIM